MSWYPEAQGEGSWVCSIGRNPDAVKDLMIDSGSQSTAVNQDFAPEYEIDDSEIPVLWDISGQPIKAYGRKLVRCEFVGDDRSSLEGCIGVDIADVSKGVASMGRILRAGFDMRYTGRGHNCWMGRGGVRSTLFQNDAKAPAPICNLRLKVLPPTPQPLQTGCIVAPVGATTAHSLAEIPPGTEVELAGLTTAMDLNGCRGRIVRKTETGKWAVK